MALVQEYSQSDLQRFTDFLREAREKCSYETGGDKVKIKKGQFTIRKIGPFTKNNLSYTDIYSGSGWFRGLEVISTNREDIWARIYNGGITNHRFMPSFYKEGIFDGLRKALREFPRDRPFIRGPDKFLVDKGEDDVFNTSHLIAYTDRNAVEIPSNFSYFERIESIDDVACGDIVDGDGTENIYHLSYLGGLLSNPKVREAYEKEKNLLYN